MPDSGLEPDPLWQALDALGEPENPMQGVTADNVLDAVRPALDLATPSYIDVEVQSLADLIQGLPKGALCLSLSESAVGDSEEYTMEASCADRRWDYILRGGLHEVVRRPNTEEISGSSTWSDLRMAYGGLAFHGDGVLEYAYDPEVNRWNIDRSWTVHGDEDLMNGRFEVKASGALGQAGLLYSGCLSAANSPTVPEGDLCFVMEEYTVEEGRTFTHILVRTDEVLEWTQE